MTVTAVELKSPLQSQEIYSDPQVRKILEHLVRSPRAVIAPEIMPTDDIRYPALESVLGTVSGAEELLSRMVSSGVLVSDMVDQTIQCPECGSRQVSTRYMCAKCYSTDISRSFLYEHLKCGKVASDDVFRKERQLICPKCQSVLHNFGVEYRVVGAWYKCNKCGESFNVPVHSHFCRPNRHQFNLERVRLSPVFQYRLNPNSIAEIRRKVLVYSEALTMLEGLGFTLRAPHDLIGRSGEPQTFDIVANAKGRWGTDKTIAVDILTSATPLSAEVVRGFASKINEARPTESYLVAVPGLTDEAKAVAQKLRVNIVEGPSIKEATLALMNHGSFRDHKA
jgi:predicted RNA-binding Zn-ribbon protein involved in translation (DUF1610 family)